MSLSPQDHPLISAALDYAARGWPVFPCNPKNKQPLLAAKKGADGKPIKGTGGVSAASIDAAQIRAWWRKWPKAMIGLATGHERMFAVDFDPRHDEVTGEEWTLERLKSEVEAQTGVSLPATLAVRTPSDGVHLYLRQCLGEPIRNRGNLPEHVDVRGLGGYVIAPPSVMTDGREYRWLRGQSTAAIADAPDGLLAVLRERGGKPTPAPRLTNGSSAERANLKRSPLSSDDAVRKYALAALDGECQSVRSSPSGQRNAQLNTSALKIASLVAAGAIEAMLARSCLEAAARDNPGQDDDRQLSATIDSGWTAGLEQPRDLTEVAAASSRRSARSSAERPPSSRPRPSPAPSDTIDGKPSSQMGDRALEGSERGRGGDPQLQGADLTRRCAFHPLTDLGNLERFLDRFGRDFLYLEAWGWLAWDGTRWNRDMAVPLLAKAAQQTVRLIQDEAQLVRSSGVPHPDPLGDIELDDDYDDDLAPQTLHDERKKRRKAKSIAWYRQRDLAKRTPDGPGDRLDSIVQVKSNGDIVLYSDKLAAWGRTSESSGHIGCLGKPDMAGARVAALTDEFDADPLKLNVANGTIVFERPSLERTSAWHLRAHRREDRMTKIAVATCDPTATCPKFDAFLAKVQPDPEMRGFLDVWSGYSALGLADAQKMVIFYGEGSNGKGVWVNTIANILADYSWATGIETFIDQGRYRKGSDASPDLAALAGRRMVYANEAEENSKFSDGLIKELTSDEPKGGVRELMKPPFTLQITFNNTISTNTLPRIGTDHGIQRRVQVVPWEVVITGADVDPRLKDKLKDEMSGILNRMLRGALAYLDDGLPMPQAIKDATAEYQQENDMLGMFLKLCVARVPGEVVGARPLWRVFAAWQTWAGQLPQSGKPWSEKHLNAQLTKKKFKSAKSSTMKWQDIALRFEADDFAEHDSDGKVLRARENDLPRPREFAGEIGLDGKPASSPSAPPLTDDDDDLPI